MPPVAVEVADPVMLNWVASNAWSLVEVPDVVLVSPPPVMVMPELVAVNPDERSAV